MINFSTVNTFEGGNSKDLSQNIEKKNTFEKGLNGRIYSKDGVFSFTAISGSKLVYENSQIIKYLGHHSFRDEAIVFAKCLIPTGEGQGTEETITEIQIQTDDFILNGLSETDTVITNSQSFISANTEIIETTYTIVVPLADEDDFELPYLETESTQEEIDFGEYYNERFNVANYKICNINENAIPLNNQEYYDTIISFKLNSEGNLTSETLWTGLQNWPLNGKITAEGVEENEFFKRVYYSDAINNRRVMNRKDVALFTRQAKEFDQILDNVLLQPRLKIIEDGGQLNSMRVLYLYRIISEQGQISEFSPFSEFADILVENEAIGYRGGDVSEITTKVSKIEIDLINPEPSSQIECIALEFESQGPPTSIKNLGIKQARAITEFSHFGNETEFIDDITIADILEFKNTWKYCNDFTSKKNKLIAAGLRNNPLPTEIQNLEYLMPLHSWNEGSNTFNSLMNPEPWNYRWIDPTNTEKLIYIKQKKYENISSFGPCLITFENRENGNFIEKEFPNLDLENYTDILADIRDWLLDQYFNNSEFLSLFPNLKIKNNGGQLLMTPINEEIVTDFADYVLKSNNNQFIENFKSDIEFNDLNLNSSKFIHGAQSAGFNQGNGVRVTYKEFKEPLLKKATKIYDGSDKLLNYNTPSGEKYCMKGEIYRLAFQAYDLASSRYFSIPLGDVMVPELYDTITYINNLGNPVIESKEYVNQSIDNNQLYGHGIKMQIEVRLSCEMQKLISMYQILYVERTEENRTILCQGIAAPLTRVQYNNSDQFKMDDRIQNKWNLPYYGGPVYDDRGIAQYDQNGEDFDYEGIDSDKRIITSRRLMYFDSPDLYFNKISDNFVKSSKLQVLARLNTDHTPGCIMEYGETIDGIPYKVEQYPKFSRKIKENQLIGNLNLEGLPRRARENSRNGTFESYFINVSVFSNYTKKTVRELSIEESRTLSRGEVISGNAFNLAHDVSNNALVMPVMPWYYGAYQRNWNTSDKKNMFGKVCTVSPGYATTIIKTKEDLFTDSFIGFNVHKVHSQLRRGGSEYKVSDSYPLINLYRNNRQSVYGGRTEQAYSRNTYIPLSKTIPVSKRTGVQSFLCGADTYMTLNIRTKNDGSDSNEIEDVTFDNRNTGGDSGDISVWKRNGAWNYVNVLETQLEPKIMYGYNFYRKEGNHEFEIPRTEIINGAYLNINNLKQFIPKPFQFKDDPDMGNVVAVSNVKLAGESYDSWSLFKPNNFYAELEKNKGDVSNIIRHKEEIYAIQEDQISQLYIGTDRIINDDQGNPINLKQGSGTVVEGHKVLNNYGTAIRRSVVNSEFGFTFFDEKHVEFVKMGKPLLAQKLLHLDLWDKVKTDPIIDAEGYYDHQYKETCIRIRTKSGMAMVISYNEMLGVFNGEYEYNNDHYISFDKKMYAPVKGQSNLLHQLNEGPVLNLFGDKKLLKTRVLVNSEIDKVLQYKQTGLITSMKYPIKEVLYKTSLGQTRIVKGDHPWYKIREGNHSIPAKNEFLTIPAKNEFLKTSELADLRGNWISIEITAESINNAKVDILAVINSLRQSHQ